MENKLRIILFSPDLNDRLLMRLALLRAGVTDPILPISSIDAANATIRQGPNPADKGRTILLVVALTGAGVEVGLNLIRWVRSNSGYPLVRILAVASKADSNAYAEASAFGADMCVESDEDLERFARRLKPVLEWRKEILGVPSEPIMPPRPSPPPLPPTGPRGG